jgi:uncharacterized membrane protein YwaF
MVLFRIAIFIVLFRILQLMLMTVNEFLYRKTSKFQLPKHFIDLCDIRDFLLLFSNRSDFLVTPEDEPPGLVKLKTL